mgnify:CR=1 FL=1
MQSGRAFITQGGPELRFLNPARELFAVLVKERKGEVKTVVGAIIQPLPAVPDLYVERLSVFKATPAVPGPQKLPGVEGFVEDRAFLIAADAGVKVSTLTLVDTYDIIVLLTCRDLKLRQEIETALASARES